jgi:hypothetical protein
MRKSAADPGTGEGGGAAPVFHTPAGILPGIPLVANLVLVILANLVAPPAITAQIPLSGRFSIEPRFGAAFPTGDFGNLDPACAPGSVGCDYPTQIGNEVGWRWELAGHFSMTDRWSLVGSFGQTKLGCSASFCDPAEEPGARTVGLGLRAHAIPLGSMDIWLEGGGVMERVAVIRTLDPEGNAVSDRVWYPWAPGGYFGAGASLPLRADGDLFFTPGFRFHYVPTDPPDSHPDLQTLNATYVVAEIGVRILLGR